MKGEKMTAKNDYILSNEEESFTDYYESELSGIERVSDIELEKVLKDVAEGTCDMSYAYNLMLPRLFDIAYEMADGRELLSDIVQEANMFCLEKMEESISLDEENILKNILDSIRKHIQEFLAEGESDNFEAQKIADKLNQILEAVEVLKAQDADYTLDDLAEFLEISVEEINELLRIAGQLDE